MEKHGPIYLDHAATTPLCAEAKAAMEPFLTEEYANPAGVYGPAFRAAKAAEEARRSIAKVLGANPYEIYFTSGGSESNSWAILGAALANREEGNHIITTKIEHHSVLHAMKYLEKLGFLVTYLPVDTKGFVDPEDLRRALSPNTILISIMHANNEIGTIEPIDRLAQIVKEEKRPAKRVGMGVFSPLFHTDAVQTMGHIPVEVSSGLVDLVSASAHKFGGPKGVGFLYIKEGTGMEALIHGGNQERGLRGGTTNVAGVVGMEAALLKAVRTPVDRALRDLLRDEICFRLEGVTVNGPNPDTASDHELTPQHLNLLVRGVKGESLVQFANLSDLYFATGSACTTGQTEPSHVLMAIGRSDEECFCSVRLTLGMEMTKEEVLEAANRFVETVNKVRRMFPYGTRV